MKEKNDIVIPIVLPKDQYAHSNAPTEWWWHVGTLYAADGRVFGFEINATGLNITEMQPSLAFTQIEITDVKKQCNYQKVTPLGVPENWAEYDPEKPWFVTLSPASSINGAISMKAIDGDPLDMAVRASFIDVNPTTGIKTPCALDLNLMQQGAPLYVWGTGCELVDSKGTSHITQNNYYYSLTHLQASGILEIAEERIEVTGLTWMDHEYGAFPQGSEASWMLQDAQLANGLHFSNYTKFGLQPKLNVAMESYMTLLENGVSHFIETITTPMEPVFSFDNITYFMTFKIVLKENEHISFIVSSLYPDQVFRDPGNANVYEGVATAKMMMDMQLTRRKHIEIEISSGAAWIEQNLR